MLLFLNMVFTFCFYSKDVLKKSTRNQICTQQCDHIFICMLYASPKPSGSLPVSPRSSLPPANQLHQVTSPP